MTNKYSIFEGCHVVVIHNDAGHESAVSGVLRVLDDEHILIEGKQGRVMLAINSITKIREKAEEAKQ